MENQEYEIRMRENGAVMVGPLNKQELLEQLKSYRADDLKEIGTAYGFATMREAGEFMEVYNRQTEELTEVSDYIDYE